LNEYAKAGQTVNKIKIKTHLSTRMAQTEAVRPSIRCRLWTNVGLPAMLLMPRVWPKGKRSQKRVKLLFFSNKTQSRLILVCRDGSDEGNPVKGWGGVDETPSPGHVRTIPLATND